MNEHAARRVEDSPTFMPRRQFLILGSAAAIGAVATSLPASQPSSALAGEGGLPLSLGFIDATLDELRAAARPHALVGAQHGGGSRLDDTVRVNVHGIVRASGSRATSPVTLDAHYRVSGVEQEVPFFAWSDHPSTRRGGSSAIEFVSHVSTASPLTLALATRLAPTWRDTLVRRLFATPAPAENVNAMARLTRRGLYFIAVPAAGQPAPNWASIRVVPMANGNLPQLEQSTLFGTRPVSFDYIVVDAERA